ncbi:hypothetical protein J0K78_06745 [Halobacillus sp. GSS1]|uniref:hypothetical protein n=1 Tax=Halobacillus sp. GSS1 TaxID=2815919 RepID=UPI001A8C1428|nr:hypothetical protein [Halobacillus sp. GSS1]MBN9653956.1 hypothetical protein [Halobacillus sp. GSS1]
MRWKIKTQPFHNGRYIKKEANRPSIIGESLLFLFCFIVIVENHGYPTYAYYAGRCAAMKYLMKPTYKKEYAHYSDIINIGVHKKSQSVDALVLKEGDILQVEVVENMSRRLL